MQSIPYTRLRNVRQQSGTTSRDSSASSNTNSSAASRSGSPTPRPIWRKRSAQNELLNTARKLTRVSQDLSNLANDLISLSITERTDGGRTTPKKTYGKMNLNGCSNITPDTERGENRRRKLPWKDPNPGLSYWWDLQEQENHGAPEISTKTITLNQAEIGGKDITDNESSSSMTSMEEKNTPTYYDGVQRCLSKYQSKAAAETSKQTHSSSQATIPGKHGGKMLLTYLLSKEE